MRIARVGMVLAVLGAAFAVLGAEKAKSEKKPAPIHASKSSTLTATVKAVDQKTRMVTLSGEDGEITFKAGKEIKNLPQLKVGDIVTTTMTESFDVRVLKPGESVPVSSEGSSTATAPLGEKPAAYTAKELYVVATVDSIDKENHIVTLKGPKGNAYPIKVKDPNRIKGLAVGDQLEIRHIKAMAVQVTAPKK